VTLPQM